MRCLRLRVPYELNSTPLYRRDLLVALCRATASESQDPCSSELRRRQLATPKCAGSATVSGVLLNQTPSVQRYYQHDFACCDSRGVSPAGYASSSFSADVGDPEHVLTRPGLVLSLLLMR